MRQERLPCGLTGGSRGHLFAGRFVSAAMDEGDPISAVHYLALGPARALRIARVEDYKWSSVRAHLELRDEGLATVAPALGRVKDFAAPIADRANEAGFAALGTAEQTGRPRFHRRTEAHSRTAHCAARTGPQTDRAARGAAKLVLNGRVNIGPVAGNYNAACRIAPPRTGGGGRSAARLHGRGVRRDEAYARELSRQIRKVPRSAGRCASGIAEWRLLDMRCGCCARTVRLRSGRCCAGAVKKPVPEKMQSGKSLRCRP